MAIRIITDSASDIEQNEMENVTVLPLTVTFDGKSYQDGIDIDKNDFYNILENSEDIPVTSLISPKVFEDYYKNILNAGDEAIVITVSSELSGTFQSANIASQDYDNISVIDSLGVTATQQILVIRCNQLISEGLDRQEIVSILEKEKKEIVAYASVDSLKYLQKGGRISKATAIAGSLIGIKPILTLDEGKLIAIGKARGSKQSNLFLSQKVAEAGGIDYSRPYAVGYSGTDNTNLLKYMENNQNLIPSSPEEVKMVQIGSAVGTHAGPGAVLVTFFAKS